MRHNEGERMTQQEVNIKTFRMHFTCSKGVNCITRVKAETRQQAKAVLIKGWDVDQIFEIWEE